MEAFAQFLSPSGRIARNPFALGAVPVYAPDRRDVPFAAAGNALGGRARL